MKIPKESSDYLYISMFSLLENNLFMRTEFHEKKHYYSQAKWLDSNKKRKKNIAENRNSIKYQFHTSAKSFLNVGINIKDSGEIFFLAADLVLVLYLIYCKLLYLTLQISKLCVLFNKSVISLLTCESFPINIIWMSSRPEWIGYF